MGHVDHSRDVRVQVGDQVYLKEGGEELGAVREVHAHELVVYVENAGDFRIGSAALISAHDGKVIVDEKHLAPELKQAIAHAHDREA